MSRRLVWLQLLIGWFPIWALFTSIIVTVHGTSIAGAALISVRMILAAAILGLAVQRITERFRWPGFVRPQFMLLHSAAAVGYSIAWIFLNSVIESAMRGQLLIIVGIGLSSFFLVGIWLYVMIAGVSYTIQSSARAANAEAAAAQSQLAALRSQLNPHFLFNALHTVVQLIPRQPAVAAQAAEQVAGLLRATLEDDRDVITLERELDFVKRYLDVEHIRFGERLRVEIDSPPDLAAKSLPSFAVQTLVENAVRHGAAPRVDPTDLTIIARMSGSVLEVRVTDTGSGINADAERTTGTGLRRLRERLGALYGGKARLEIAPRENGGTSATLLIPQEKDD
jgi:signal transduction histidine kinase